MAISHAVVATRVGGVPELVEDRITGFLVPPRDPDALAEALRGSSLIPSSAGVWAKPAAGEDIETILRNFSRLNREDALVCSGEEANLEARSQHLTLNNNCDILSSPW